MSILDQLLAVRELVEDRDFFNAIPALEVLAQRYREEGDHEGAAHVMGHIQALAGVLEGGHA